LEVLVAGGLLSAEEAENRSSGGIDLR
jgi:hypothetical protein